MATLPIPAQPAPLPLIQVIEPLLVVPQAARILGIPQCTLRNCGDADRGPNQSTIGGTDSAEVSIEARLSNGKPCEA